MQRIEFLNLTIFMPTHLLPFPSKLLLHLFTCVGRWAFEGGGRGEEVGVEGLCVPLKGHQHRSNGILLENSPVARESRIFTMPWEQ